MAGMSGIYRSYIFHHGLWWKIKRQKMVASSSHGVFYSDKPKSQLALKCAKRYIKIYRLSRDKDTWNDVVTRLAERLSGGTGVINIKKALDIDEPIPDWERRYNYETGKYDWCKIDLKQYGVRWPEKINQIRVNREGLPSMTYKRAIGKRLRAIKRKEKIYCRSCKRVKDVSEDVTRMRTYCGKVLDIKTSLPIIIKDQFNNKGDAYKATLEILRKHECKKCFLNLYATIKRYKEAEEIKTMTKQLKKTIKGDL
jgi:hypothetical protein